MAVKMFPKMTQRSLMIGNRQHNVKEKNKRRRRSLRDEKRKARLYIERESRQLFCSVVVVEQRVTFNPEDWSNYR